MKKSQMTVGELIELLEDFPRDALVMCAYPSHDYWHTKIAYEPTVATETHATWSEYHRQWKPAPEFEDPSDDDFPVVLIG